MGFIIRGTGVEWRILSKQWVDITTMLNKGPSYISFDKFLITRKAFPRIISSATALNKLRFSAWKINTQGIKLRKTFSNKIRALEFFNCGAADKSNWVEYPQRVYDLLLAISNSNLKDNLECINFYKMVFTTSQMNEWMETLGLDKLQVHFTDKESRQYSSMKLIK